MPITEELERPQDTALACPRCQTANAPQRKFCARCGTPLWEPCFRCGKSCAAGETYCGACGACQAELAAEHIERAESDLQRAADMQSGSRFDDAIIILTSLAKKTHPRLAEYVARARQRVDQLADQRRRQRLAADETRHRALRCLAASDYDGAAELLDSIPEGLRDDEVRQLREKIAEQQREIDQLADQLRDAVTHNRMLELSPLIERLMTLKPDHAYARSIAEQVQQRLVALAKKLLAEHRYDDALDLLDQVSVWSDATNFQQLYRHVAELAWLDHDLRNAPTIDDTLVAIAERLRRLAPDNARAVRLCDELVRRAKLAAGRQQPLTWARAPEQTPFATPVDWLTTFRRLACAETFDPSGLARHPGRLAVASGLAMAGLKQAAIPIDLLSGQQLSVMQRLKYLMQPQTTNSAWGIDVGAGGLKAVKLTWNKTKQQPQIEAATVIEHAKPLTYAINEAEETKIVSETLKQFLAMKPISTERVCVGLPGRMTLSRQVETPSVDPAKAAKLVQFEASIQFPFPLEQLAWDFHIFANPSDPNDSTKKQERTNRVLLIAAKRPSVQHFLDAFQRLDLRVDLLQPDFVALHNYLVYDYFHGTTDSPSAPCPAVAALDVGCDVTNIVVSTPESLWFHSCGVAGQNFTRALVKEFNLTIAQAEARKRSPEKADRLSDHYAALAPVFDDLQDEVQQSLTAYAQTESAAPIRHILGLGGGFSLHGLFRRLRCGR